MTLAVLLQIALAVALTLGGLTLGLGLRRWVLPRASGTGAQTRSGAGDVLLAALRGPLVLWCAMLGAYLASELVALPAAIGPVLRRLLMVLVIVSVSWSLSRAAFAAVAARARALGKPVRVAYDADLEDIESIIVAVGKGRDGRGLRRGAGIRAVHPI